MLLARSFLNKYLSIIVFLCTVLFSAQKTIANTNDFYPKVSPIIDDWKDETICWSALNYADDLCLIYNGTPTPSDCVGNVPLPAVDAVTNYADIKSFGCDVLGIDYDRENPWMDDLIPRNIVAACPATGPRLRYGVENHQEMLIVAKYITGGNCDRNIEKKFLGSRNRDVYCPENATNFGNHEFCYCVEKSDVVAEGMCLPPPQCDPTTQNPCNIATGAKLRSETDSHSGSTLTRLYDSQFPVDYGLGKGWRISLLHRRLEFGENTLLFLDGRRSDVWEKIEGTWQPRANNRYSLEVLTEGYRLIMDTSGYLEFDSNGHLLSEETASGSVRTYGYTSKGKIKKRIDEYGKSINLEYDPSGEKILSIWFDDNAKFRYSYDGNKNLISVIYPDNTPNTLEDNAKKIYHYEDTRFPNHLTGITDENGMRHQTYSYDEYGKVISSEKAHTSNSVGQERVELRYNGEDSYTTWVTDADGNEVQWQFRNGPLDARFGVKNPIRKRWLEDRKFVFKEWDDNNNLVKVSRFEENFQDRERNPTTRRYTYNATNQKTSMVEAAGSVNERTTTYEYISSDIDLVTRTTMPSVNTGQIKEVINTYDENLNVTQTAINGYTVDGTVVNRVTTFDYDNYGKVTEINSPRTDVSDITSFEYYNCTTGAECGQLKQVTNALGHTTTYDSYDANSRLLQSTDANGVVTTNTYHPRGWLLSRTQTAPNGEVRTTSYEYDNVGQMTQTTSPDGIVLSYEYDAAHDLRAITDNMGNRIEYSYDSRGNRNVERTLNGGDDGTLVREVQTVYDIRNFIEAINSGGSITQMVNDAVGNVTQQTDPNANPNTSHTYDALDRLESTLDALTNTTDYTYNVADQLIQVTAPNGASTQYEYDDLGNLLKEISPDRGTILYQHDLAGNVISQTDARGITVSYQYDALNRLSNVNFPNTEENIQYSYDTCSLLGVGRLCTTNHAAGSEAITYDAWGNIIKVIRQEAGLALDVVSTGPVFTTHYAYDVGNRLVKVTYPSGRTVDYIRDDIGRIISITSRAVDGTLTPIITGREYRADGLWTRQDYANGLNQSKAYDTQGRLTSHTAGDYFRSYDYDANGNIIDINGSLNALYEYDPLDRLVKDTAADLGIDISFDYDANGNRTEETDAGLATTLSYEAESNRSAAIGSTNINLDPSGRTLSDTQGREYTYNDAGRLKSLNKNGQIAGQYQYNANQLRTLKRVGTNNAYTLFHYDLAGNMLAESDIAGNASKEYVYVDGERVAVFDSSYSNTIMPLPDVENNATVYEDAEDGSTIGWDIYDQNPTGATISNVFDADKNSQVIELSGDATKNGYRLGHQLSGRANSWGNTTQKIIQWDGRFSANFYAYVGVQTTNGFRYLRYQPRNSDLAPTSNQIRIGIGSGKRNGDWHTITRDLNADLKKFEPNNDVLEVNGLLVRGSGRMDNIQLLDTLPQPIYEDAEDGSTIGWDIYDQNPTGATISNVFDADKNSQVIELSGDATKNGYRLGHQLSGRENSWGNTTQKVIQWDGRFSANFYAYVGVQTTDGFRYLRYQPRNSDLAPTSNQIRIGIGTDKRNGDWHTITRDLNADLKRFEPNNNVLEVNGLLVRGSGRIDNIQLLDTEASVETVVNYYINDHLSTPQRLVDETGEVSWEATYEAFGAATITTEDVVQNHRFPGQYYDAESGLYYNWNRYYDAQVGRYVTSDPIGLEGGYNTYSYVYGNPLSYMDISGLKVTGSIEVIRVLGVKYDKIDSGFQMDYQRGETGVRLYWADLLVGGTVGFGIYCTESEECGGEAKRGYIAQYVDLPKEFPYRFHKTFNGISWMYNIPLTFAQIAHKTAPHLKRLAMLKLADPSRLCEANRNWMPSLPYNLNEDLGIAP